MVRLAKEIWEQIRAEREVGLSYNLLASRYGVNKATIIRRAKLEGWKDGANFATEIRRKAMEKASTFANLTESEKKAATIDSVADDVAVVIQRHRAEAERVREIFWRGMDKHQAAKTVGELRLAFEILKGAKISSETLINLQRAQRISYGLDNDTPNVTEIVIERSYGATPPVQDDAT